jgi:hypothetical protein
VSSSGMNEAIDAEGVADWSFMDKVFRRRQSVRTAS